ncbi:hypothetical protein M434DRAFT_396529 [Hypoxylon sp. CO27-5]|nr:hypothetical protein M434DRAFT_396529 [Hypoxylon sp. CO27-5]
MALAEIRYYVVGLLYYHTIKLEGRKGVVLRIGMSCCIRDAASGRGHKESGGLGVTHASHPPMKDSASDDWERPWRSCRGLWVFEVIAYVILLATVCLLYRDRVEAGGTTLH